MNTWFFSQVNWLAVIVAAIAYFLLGAIWFSKALFAPRWISLLKIDVNDPDMKKGIAAIMLTSFILMLLTSLGLAILVERMNVVLLSGAIKLGLLTGLLIAVASLSISYVYEKRPLGLHLITGGYLLAGNIIVAVILVLWR